MVHRLEERMYLNADKSKVVKEGDPDAAYLLGGPGHEISDAEAERYGLKANAKQSGDEELRQRLQEVENERAAKQRELEERTGTNPIMPEEKERRQAENKSRKAEEKK